MSLTQAAAAAAAAVQVANTTEFFTHLHQKQSEFDLIAKNHLDLFTRNNNHHHNNNNITNNNNNKNLNINNNIDNENVNHNIIGGGGGGSENEAPKNSSSRNDDRKREQRYFQVSISVYTCHIGSALYVPERVVCFQDSSHLSRSRCGSLVLYSVVNDSADTLCVALIAKRSLVVDSILLIDYVGMAFESSRVRCSLFYPNRI